MNAPDTKTSIDVRQAVRIARNYLLEVTDTETGTLPHLLVEEVEFSDAENAWLITFGFDTGRVVESLEEGEYDRYLGTKRTTTTIERAYKLVRVSADGEPISMKNRLLI